MMAWLLVFVGAGVGGALRHGINLVVGRWSAFPLATLTVNVLGSLLMGIAAAWFLAKPGASQDLRLFITAGLLGGFTTFSAFSLDSATLLHRGQIGLAALYAVISVFASVAALFLGLWLFRSGAPLP